MNLKLAQEGVILANDGYGNPQIQKIDDPIEFAEEHNLEYVKQLSSDKEAVDIVREFIIDNYIEVIYQDLQEGDRSLLYALLKGQGLAPIEDLTEQEVIAEAKELQIL